MLPRSLPSTRVRALLVAALVLVLAGVLVTATGSGRAQPDRARLVDTTSPRHTFAQITSHAQFRAVSGEGTAVSGGALRISRPAGRLVYAGRTWSWSRWTSAWVRPGHSFSELIPSWNVTTPGYTWVQVLARVRSTTGRTSGWKVMGSWTTRDAAFRRTSAGTQRDSVAGVSTDTIVARSGVALAGYQLRVRLHRALGGTLTPVVRSLQAVASRPVAGLPATSRRLLPGRTLAVPRYSQMIHRGEYPQYGGGGQAWCSPTALSMILRYYRSLPSPANYAWVDRSYSDRWVDHVARVVYDYGYRGAGNWAFNTAYAANLTTDAFVTRLNSLRDAERFIAAGIPLAASITFGSGQLSGAPISATAGHLVVISGFTSSGDVVVNDPAAPRNSSVRRVYDRGQFERAWLRRSSGTVYVVRDAAHPLPARGAAGGW